MIKTNDVAQLVEQAIKGRDMFLVEVIVTPDNRIEVSLDSPTGVSVDDCVCVSRFLEDNMNREEEDYELMVASSGLSEPLKILKQYEKNIGKEIEVILINGQKKTGILRNATDSAITIDYEVKELIEGKKRKQTVVRTEKWNLDDIKSTKVVVHVK
ncbi:MAG: ribosome assembly cofactor RimP [Prevotellaceae bacterium]|jgi:ribosome maturation factor RimP|nr:ribosome assembly cofactor RimP [Prevotellaceae bacterium]